MNLLGSNFLNDPTEDTEPLLLIISLLKDEAETESEMEEALILSMPSSQSGSL